MIVSLNYGLCFFFFVCVCVFFFFFWGGGGGGSFFLNGAVRFNYEYGTS